MNVKELKEQLKDVPDHARVTVDTEGRMFFAHLYEATGGEHQPKEMVGEDLFVITPDYTGAVCHTYQNAEEVYGTGVMEEQGKAKEA